MSSAVKVNAPSSRRAPISMSSKKCIYSLLRIPVAPAHNDRRFHLAQHDACGVADRPLECHDACLGSALGNPRLCDVDVERQIVTGTQWRQPAHLVDAGRAERGGAADKTVEQH